MSFGAIIAIGIVVLVLIFGGPNLFKNSGGKNGSSGGRNSGGGTDGGAV